MRAEGAPREVPGCNAIVLPVLAGLAALLWRWLR